VPNLDKVRDKVILLINKIALWMLAVSVIFFGLVTLIDSIVGAIFILIAGVLALPPIFNLLRARLSARLPSGNVYLLGGLILVLFFAGVKLTSSQQDAEKLDKKQKTIQEAITEWQENKEKILAEFEGYLSRKDISKATQIVDKYTYAVKGDLDIQAMSEKVKELAYLEKKKANGPSDINDLLLPRNWPAWGSDGKKYYRNFVDINKDYASFAPGSYYKRYQLMYSGDGTIIGLYGQPATTKSHREIRERMAELCGLNLDQIQVVEGGGFYNAEFSGKYAKCAYGYENNSNTLDVTFSRK
jgi:hypothetical protein